MVWIIVSAILAVGLAVWLFGELDEYDPEHDADWWREQIEGD